MKKGSQVTTGYTSWTSSEVSSESGPRFIVKDANGDPKAVLTQNGMLYLAGTVTERQTEPETATSGHTALKIRDTQGSVVSLIDDEGNLIVKGYVLEEGIPYALRAPVDYRSSDHFFTW